MRREEKNAMEWLLEILEKSDSEDTFALQLQVEYLKLKLSKAQAGCKKLRAEVNRLKTENQMLEDNMGNLLCTREEEIKYNRQLNENLTKAAEINALIAGKLSVYESVKKAEQSEQTVQAEK